MNITELSQVTVPVDIEHGNAKLTLHCYIEKISTENTEYDALLTDERAARIADELANQQQIILMDPAYLQSRLLPDSDKPLSPKQMTARAKEIQESIPKLAEARRATEAALIHNLAERIVYLTKSWSFTHTVDGAEQPLPVTVESIKRHMSVGLIRLLIHRIEEGVFGPFV